MSFLWVKEMQPKSCQCPVAGDFISTLKQSSTSLLFQCVNALSRAISFLLRATYGKSTKYLCQCPVSGDFISTNHLLASACECGLCQCPVSGDFISTYLFQVQEQFETCVNALSRAISFLPVKMLGGCPVNYCVNALSRAISFLRKYCEWT